MRHNLSRNRDYVFFIAPTRGGGWRVVKVMEHGPYHDTRPRTWRGPFATWTAAANAAHDAATVVQP